MEARPTSDIKSYWIIVADSAKAQIFVQETRRSPVSEFLEFENDSARLKKSDFESDRPGRSFDSVGRGKHSMAKESADPKRLAATRFARKIAEYVHMARLNESCRGFALIAEPSFLGHLRHAFDGLGDYEPFLTVNKNLVGSDHKTIERIIAKK